MVSPTLTSQGFTSCSELAGGPGDKISSIYSQSSTASFLSVVARNIVLRSNCWPTKRGVKKQPVYLHSMLAAPLASRSLRSNNNNSLSVPRVKTITGTRGFHSCAPFIWNNLPVSVHSAVSVDTVDTSLWIGLYPIDTGMLDGPLMLRKCVLDFAVEHWFGHWAWLCWRYWRYRSLIDWLIEI